MFFKEDFLFEAFCYLGVSFSWIIARNTYRIKNKNFISNFLVLYFTMDFIMGFADTFLLFKLRRERFDF